MSSLPVSLDELSIIFELEDDPIKGSELGSSASKQVNQYVPSPDDNEIRPERHYETAPTHTGYISFQLSTIQPLGGGNTLFISRLHFHPAIRARFLGATVTWRFMPPEPTLLNPTPPPPKIVMHAPRVSYSGVTKQRNRRVWGLELPLSVGVSRLFAVGLTPTMEQETITEVEHATTIIGTARGGVIKTCVVWTLEENDATESGLPPEIELATITEHSGPIRCKIDVKAKVKFEGNPLCRRLRMKAGSGKTHIILDGNPYQRPGVGHCLENFNLEECIALLKGWTGQVDDALV